MADRSGSVSQDAVAIAVIGMGWRGPGDATNVSNFYDMLAAAREARVAAHKAKWNHEAFYHPESSRKGTSNVEAGHYFQDDLSRFDAPFFSMTDSEASCLDPQQRLLLETCYEALENAGIPLTQAAGSQTSVFVSTFGADYTDLLQRDPDQMPIYQATNSGYSRAIISNRLSHFFDFRGTSVTIDTACSGGLAALHLACQSIRAGESRQAVCGGSSVILHPDQFISLSAMRFLSPDGRCYSFDERANGYARGEGVGCILLKRVDHALADGDPIRAIIRMTGSNQDGRTPGISFPSKTAQMALIKSVYERAGLNPLETTYVEAHGTGTQAGDPIETSAISEVMCPGRPPEAPLTVGSVKANIGHLEAASGIAALIKSVLMLENRVIFPNRNFVVPNARIPLKSWNLRIPVQLDEWHCDGPRRLSINSFGYGGTNAHAILESADGFLANTSKPTSRTSVARLPPSYPPEAQNGSANGHGLPDSMRGNAMPHASVRRVFLLSAFDEMATRQMARDLARHLGTARGCVSDVYLDHVAHTLASRRSRFAHLAAVVASDVSELIAVLEEESLAVSRAPAKARTIGFVFTGQGAQWAGMGRELMDAYPVYARTIQRCRDHLLSIGATWDLIDELAKDAQDSRIARARFSQPLCSAVQIGLVELLASWSIQPRAVTGHSSGEIAAAYAAGFISLEDAMSSAYYRGVLSERVATEGPVKGAMMAVGVGPAGIQERLSSLKTGYATVACENSPSSVTISGDLTAVEELREQLESEGTFARRLLVEAAYHSRHMALVEKDYISSIADMKIQEGCGVKFFSSVTGKRAPKEILGPSYWADNMLGRVRFASSLNLLCREGVDVLVEVGPHSALSGPVKQIIQADAVLKENGCKYFSVLTRKHDAAQTAVAMAARLAMEGVEVSLPAVNKARDHADVAVDLPPYPWNKSKSYWAESRLSKEYRNRPHPRLDLLGRPDSNFNPADARWRNIIRASELPWIKDHRIQSEVVYPAAGYVSMAIEGVKQLAWAKSQEPKGFNLREVTIGQALVIPSDTDGIETSITLRPQSEGNRVSSDVWFEFFVYSVSEDNRWTEHCRGLISIDKSGADNTTADDACLAADMEQCCTQEVPIGEFYERLAGLGLGYGPSFARMISARRAPFSPMQTTGACVSRVALPDIASIMPAGFQHPHSLHPAVLDSVLHSIFAAVGAESGHLRDPMVPVFMDSLYVSGAVPQQPRSTLSVYTSTKTTSTRHMQASLTVLDPGHPSNAVIRLGGLVCTKLAHDTIPQEYQGLSNTAYDLAWEVEPCVPIIGPTGTGETMEDISAEHLSLYILRNLVEGVSASLQPPGARHLEAFYEWSKTTLEEKDTSSFGSCTGGAERPLTDEASPESRLLHHVGQNLPDVLMGRQTLRAILGRDDLVRDAFEKAPASQHQVQEVMKYLSSLGRVNPHLEVLEFGAGTGWYTEQFLEAIGSIGEDVPRLVRYDLVSSSNSSAVKLTGLSDELERLVRVKDTLPTKNTGQQDRVAYDVAIGVLASLETDCMTKTLKEIRQILKPGGKFIMFEPGKECIPSAVIFGSLPSWPPGHQQWADIVQGAGFSLQSPGPDGRDTSRGTTGFLSTLISWCPPPQAAEKPEVVIIVGPGHQESGMVDHLAATLGHIDGLRCTVSGLEDTASEGKVCILLWEFLRTILPSPSVSQFDALRRIFTDSHGILSVTPGTLSDPVSAMVTGFARTARSELSDGAGLLLSIDPDSSVGQVANAILEVLGRHFWTEHTVAPVLDSEYCLQKGRVMVPRLVPAADVNRDVALALGKVSAEPANFLQPGRPLRAEIGSPGLMDTIHFVDDEEMAGELSSGYVEIEVQAVGLNFRDVMMALGQIEVEALGGECSGVVTRVGESVGHISVGDRVCALKLGTFRSHVRCDARLVQVIPGGLAVETAAALPVVFCTAFYSVFHAAHLQAGESVLIHAASGGLGQALIQLCQRAGADIFVTVGSDDKRELVARRFGIPDDHILHSRDNSFHSAIMRLTGGRGIDVIMNSLAGEGLRLSWSCIAPFGRFVELGKRDFFVNTRLEMAKFAKNVSFTAVDLVDLIKLKPEFVATLFTKSFDLFGQGAVEAPWPITTYPMSQLNTALQMMQSGRHKGKLVVVPCATDIVQVLPAPKRVIFKADSTYLLAGGLGGLGRAIARWMVDNGARHLVICSRSGGSSPEAKQAVQKLRQEGVVVETPLCDIADSAQLQLVMDEVMGHMPPVRGVIQSAMVLRDVMLGNMRVGDFDAVVRPKVQGTLNLHTTFGEGLDFFIMLSSISGIIGNASQAAYAAGNTFLDSFAAFRHGLGRPAVTIDLGVMAGIGYLAENHELAEAMVRQGFSVTTEPELLVLLATAVQNPYRGHLVTGLGNWTAESSLGNFAKPLFHNFRRLCQHRSGDGGSSKSPSSLRGMLGDLKDTAAATQVIRAALVGEIAALGMVDLESISTARPMTEYGIDSLVAVEMRNWIFREMDVTVAILELMMNQPIDKLIKKIAESTPLLKGGKS